MFERSCIHVKADINCNINTVWMKVGPKMSYMFSLGLKLSQDSIIMVLNVYNTLMLLFIEIPWASLKCKRICMLGTLLLYAKDKPWAYDLLSYISKLEYSFDDL